MLIIHNVLFAQDRYKEYISDGWKFKNTNQTAWSNINIPCDVHTELVKRKMMANPYWGYNDSLANVIDNSNWEFATSFDVSISTFNQKNIELVLEGLDTYTKVYLNDNLLGETYNVHRNWIFNIKPFLRYKNNEILIVFSSAQRFADSIKQKVSHAIPSDSRAFVRKAAYQFGTHASPKILTVGIIKPIYIIGSSEATAAYPKYSSVQPIASFDKVKKIFTVQGKPVFVNGINLMPPGSLLNMSMAYYDSIIKSCKDLNINLIRVWGGGIYPPEYFYQLCDENKIMIWQDFMFINKYLPTDDFFKKELVIEVEDVIRRLRHHSSIVLWCGNSGVPYTEMGISFADVNSAEAGNSLSHNYNVLFDTDIPNLLHTWDGDARAYIASPQELDLVVNNTERSWGIWYNENSNHKNKVINYEYGIASMPDIHSVAKFVDVKQMTLTNPSFYTHMKCADGFNKIRNYMEQYCPEHKDSLGYVYFSQVAHKEIIEQKIMEDKAAFPKCNATIPYYLNDIWPGISFGLKDYYNRPKAAYYAVKRKFQKNALVVGKVLMHNGTDIISTNNLAGAIVICDPTFDALNYKTTITICDMYGDALYKTTTVEWRQNDAGNFYTTTCFDNAFFNSFNWAVSYMQVSIKSKDGMDKNEILFFEKPKNLKLQPSIFETKWIDVNTIKITSVYPCKNVFLYSNNPLTQFEDNYFDLLPGEDKYIKVNNFTINKDELKVLSQTDLMYEY
jgi:beta-mannosidase